MTLVLPTAKSGRKFTKQLVEFAEELQIISKEVGFKISARGWAYTLEGMRLINKDQFDRVESLINTCRERGYLPIDFTAEEEGRKFSGVEIPSPETIPEFTLRYFKEVFGQCEDYFIPEWWNGEKYYIQMLVEKVDLKTLFEPICKQYKIPVATSKGWSSMLQRAEYAQRFKLAEDQGLKCVLLYCGDFDPDGLQISKFLFDNLDQLKNITWEDGTEGYDPTNLIIHRFGLDYKFIERFDLTWIDNLITGSGGELACVMGDKIVQGRTKQGKPHPNFYKTYVQEYLKNYGVRKCEANAIVKNPSLGQGLCQIVIEAYLGKDSLERFQKRRDKINTEFVSFRENLWIDPSDNDRFTLDDAIACFGRKIEMVIEDQAFKDGQDANPDE